MLWSELWFGQNWGQRALRALLTPASWLYEGGWNAYAGIYRTGLKKSAQPHFPIVCVGNLTVGGSGKTPMASYLAEVLQGLGHEVVLGCSGYGSPGSEGASLAPAGDLSALRWGDEASLLRWKLPRIPLVIGRDRVRAAQICHDSHPGAVLLMDDGFQHLPLKKDVVILLDPPLPNQRCLPAGPYREPSVHKRRADLVIPGQFAAVYGPTRFLDAETGLAAVRPPRANVLCAIGAPERLIESLSESGIELGTTIAKPDHHTLQEGNLFDGFPRHETLIVTLKDWVKLREREDLADRRILIAQSDVKVEPEDAFKSWLEERLHEADKKAH